MVKKHNGSWRMCVDFKDLNKACPKDGYPLPEIDWKMPFGLRNAGATYQRLVDKAFHKQIDRNLELNPKKCTFGVEEGMFSGYKVNTKGMKVCSNKVDVVLILSSPKCLKDVQKLNGKLASLNRFLAKSAEKSLPFFKTLKKCTNKGDFCWTDKAESAFKQMKQHIAELPMPVAPNEKEELIIYLAAARESISAVLMTESKAKQMSIYFVSRALRGPEVNYTSMEKLVLSLVHASKRLKRYFQAHPIIVITDHPIKQVLSKPEVTDGSGTGLILTRPEGMEFTYALRFGFEATNNEAKYEALTAGLRIVEQMGIKNLQANVDSRLVANQVNRTYIAKETDMVRYLEKVKTLTNGFQMFTIKQVPRSENKKADALSKIASTSFAHLSKQVLVEELKEKSINEVEVLAIVEEEEEGETWMTPIHDYITGGILPAEADRARAVKRKARPYSVVNGIIFKKSFLGLWLRCVGPLQANYVLREIHEGSCSMHAGTRSVVSKALQIGYYWPTMHKDARELIWKWGIDIAGPFPEGPGKVKFGLPGEIISDNGKQFRDNPFKDWCEKLSIRQRFAFVKHPQTNGLVERGNRSLREGIKVRLEAKSKDWMEEISHVLWAHHTMIKSSNKYAPFSLTYGTEAVIPAEIGMPTIRTAEVDVVRNDEALEVNLDLLEERREQAAIREAKSKRKMEKYYNMKVRNTSFKPRDLVYRNNDANNMEQGGRLGPKREGPYEVTEALGKGAYKLRGRDDKQLPRTCTTSRYVMFIERKCLTHADSAEKRMEI
ncbi:reverse transcriptase domain-containing protein [Tanacetum coccineum]|uniref:Reverse transcriptase domain-containing protein n=1 Tax=Tanacetum coccineum TaxID=301880 RepID=A0ABQ4XYA5_9ASTR